MKEMLLTKKLYIGAGAVLMAFGLLIGFLYGNITDAEIQKLHITLSNNNANLAELKQEPVPLDLNAAVATNWERYVLCIAGRGEYLTNPNKPYLLNYTSAGELASIYVISTSEQPSPWRYTEELTPNEMNLVEYEHWSLIVHFQNPLNFCKSGERDRAAASGYAGQGYKSTPTPFMSPTPTPAPSDIIENIASKLSALTSVTLEVTTDPEGISVISEINAKTNSESLPKTFAEIIKNLKDAGYGNNSWINNISHKSLTGNIDSSTVKTLVPDASANKSVTLTIWITDDNNLKRMQLKGALSDTDNNESTRTFDLK